MTQKPSVPGWLELQQEAVQCWGMLLPVQRTVALQQRLGSQPAITATRQAAMLESVVHMHTYCCPNNQLTLHCMTCPCLDMPSLKTLAQPLTCDALQPGLRRSNRGEMGRPRAASSSPCLKNCTTIAVSRHKQHFSITQLPRCSMQPHASFLTATRYI
jgi:hypothetical protein